jgi:hypothetical protein
MMYLSELYQPETTGQTQAPADAARKDVQRL